MSNTPMEDARNFVQMLKYGPTQTHITFQLPADFEEFLTREVARLIKTTREDMAQNFVKRILEFKSDE